MFNKRFFHNWKFCDGFFWIYTSANMMMVGYEVTQNFFKTIGNAKCLVLFYRNLV